MIVLFVTLLWISVVKSDSIEPYPYLNGGVNNGSKSPHNPDPIQSYIWALDKVNQTQLQVFYLESPVSADLLSHSHKATFGDLSAFTTPNPQKMIVVTSGEYASVRLDFGQTNAAWFEFDSPDLPLDEAAAYVTMGISEYNEYGIFNVGPKVKAPTPYKRTHGNATTTTYRLELNDELYEGVRFAFLTYNNVAKKGIQWHITALRLVCQMKPTNWPQTVF
eukprot:PhF_6_TR6056/c0_g1_i2/m.8772